VRTALGCVVEPECDGDEEYSVRPGIESLLRNRL